MLFNSFGFLFVYLPLVVAAYFWLARSGRPMLPAAWLALASLLFYAYWNPRHVLLLLLSMAVNYGCGRALMAQSERRRCWLMAGLLFDFGLLAYYKYANFLVANVDGLTGIDWHIGAIALPIGISFFTFTQVAFLVDCYRGHVAQVRWVHYVLFVSYFPHLIAGPILHHKEMMPQFAAPASRRPLASNFAIGLSIFVLGLAKKLLIADNLAPMVGPVFAPGVQPPLLEAWLATLAYTFQLYFDFSGYSDMAIGLSRLFGVRLPVNFASPYQAGDISAFWRRWHMTLSRFLRDYLYITLGGSRHGRWLRYRNLMLTMLLGGLWHGAGWTFIVWGGLHGTYLVLHQGWSRWLATAAWRQHRCWRVASVMLTFLCVMVAWVFFRAPDLASAGQVLAGLAGLNGIGLPQALARYQPWLAALGLHASYDGIRWIELGGLALPTLAAAAGLAFFAPNLQEIFSHFEANIERIVHRRWTLAWQPSALWSLACAGLFLACLMNMNRVAEFLYFQF